MSNRRKIKGQRPLTEEIDEAAGFPGPDAQLAEAYQVMSASLAAILHAKGPITLSMDDINEYGPLQIKNKVETGDDGREWVTLWVDE